MLCWGQAAWRASSGTCRRPLWVHAGGRGRGQGGMYFGARSPRLRRHPPVRDVFSLKPSTLGSV